LFSLDDTDRRLVKTIFIIVLLLAARALFAQSSFDPVVADQIRHQQQELERLKRQMKGEPEPPPTPPEPPSAHFVYPPDGYERALAKYEADLARYEAAHGIKRDAATQAQIDEIHRKSAGISRADWEKRKLKNDPFSNGTFNHSSQAAATQSSAVDDGLYKAALLNSLKIAIGRYPQFADPNSAFTKKYIEVSARRKAFMDDHEKRRLESEKRRLEDDNRRLEDENRRLKRELDDERRKRRDAEQEVERSRRNR